MAMGVGIREVLVYAETAHKEVTVTAGMAILTGAVSSVTPLVLNSSEGPCAYVVNPDMIIAVSINGMTGDELAGELRPKGESRFSNR